MTLRWIDTSLPHKWVCVLPAVYTADELIHEFGLAMEALRQLPPGHRIVVLTESLSGSGWRLGLLPSAARDPISPYCLAVLP